MKAFVVATLAIVIANLGMADTVKIAKNTELLKVELETSHSHNCPSELSLLSRYHSKDVYHVEFDSRIQTRVDYLKNEIPTSCADEISAIEHQEQSGPVCLSIGRSQGTVFIPISQWARPSEMTIDVPLSLRIKKITQLAPAISTAVVDCEVEPSIMCCMAETSSCTQCRQDVAAKLRHWQESCLED